MASNTGFRSVGELLIMARTCDVAVSCASASLSLRVSSAIFFLLPVRGAGAVAVRRGGFIVLRRFVFRLLARPVVTQSPSGLGTSAILARCGELRPTLAMGPL